MSMSRTTVSAAAIYCRISQDRAGEGLGVQRQEALCRQLAAAKGWPVDEVYVDSDRSAYTGKSRPAYQRLLADLQAGLRDAVLVVDQDRLTRHPAELERFIDLADHHGVALANVSGEVDLSTSDGRFRARLMGAVARQESEKKSERLRRQRDQAAQKGLPAGGRRAFGYDNDGMTVRQDEAALVREAAGRFLAGHSLRTIVRDWNARGVRPVTARQWRVTTLKTVLTNPRHCGLRIHRGEVLGAAAWPSIVDRETHERIRALLGDPRRHKRGRPPAYLLTSMLVCGPCGQRLTSSKRVDGSRRYLCHATPGSDGCGRIAIQAAPLEAEVRDQVLAVLAGPRLAAMLATDGDAGPRADALREVEAAEERLAALASAFAAGTIGQREWLAGRDVAEQRIVAARRALDHDGRTRLVSDLPHDLDALRVEWDARDVESRRAILAAVIDRVVVKPAASKGRRAFDPNRIAIRWRA